MTLKKVFGYILVTTSIILTAWAIVVIFDFNLKAFIFVVKGIVGIVAVVSMFVCGIDLIISKE